MKKLYRKSIVHPSPPPPSRPPSVSDPLAFLPVAILTLAAALTPDDREVLAYLLSCYFVSSVPKQGKIADVMSGGGGGAAHAAAFNCDCFSCYTNYWARWDSSPNRQLIHEIIDAYEDWIPAMNRGRRSSKNREGRRERKKKGMDGRDSPGADRIADVGFAQGDLGMSELVEHGGGTSGSGGVAEEEEEKESVKKLVSFIGERIWGLWG